MKNVIRTWCLALAALFFIPNADVSAQVSSDGRMWRYNLARTSAYPAGPTAFPLVLKWKGDASVYVSPVVADGRVYIPAGAWTLRSYNASTGGTNWTWQASAAEQNSMVGMPSIGNNGFVYFTITYGVSGGNKSKIYCIRASDKSQVWSYDAGFVLSYTKESPPPAVSGGVVYAVMNNGFVHAVDATTGAFRWSFNTGTRTQTAPALSGSTLYVAPVGKLYALNTANGAVRWSLTIPGWTQSSPAVASNIVVLGSNDGKVHAYDATTGAAKWTFNTGKWVNGFMSSPAISGSSVFIGAGDDIKKVFALNLTTGAQQWVYAAPGRTGMSSPAVSNGSLYITTLEGHVIALNTANGALRWSTVLGTSGGGTSPAVWTNRVFIAAYDTANFQKLHSFGP